MAMVHQSVSSILSKTPYLAYIAEPIPSIWTKLWKECAFISYLDVWGI